MDDSDSDDSILMQKPVMRTRPRGRKKGIENQMNNIMNESMKMVKSKKESVTKIIKANQSGTRLDDGELDRIKAVFTEKPRKVEKELPGFDGTFTKDVYEAMIEEMELEGTYSFGKLDAPIRFHVNDNLFFQNVDKAVQHLKGILTQETDLQKRLLLVVEKNLLVEFVSADRFEEMLAAEPSESTKLLGDWLLRVACSRGHDSLQQLGWRARNLLVKNSLQLSSGTLLGHLKCWVPDVNESAATQPDNALPANADSNSNLSGLQSVISIFEVSLKDVEMEDVHSCVLRLLRIGLSSTCNVTALMERLLAQAPQYTPEADRIESICTAVCQWGSTNKDPSGLWMSLTAAAKLFPVSLEDSTLSEFSVAVVIRVAKLCVGVEQFDHNDEEHKNTQQSLHEIVEGSAREAVESTMFALSTINNHFDDIAEDGMRCRACLECIAHLYRTGFLLIRKGCTTRDFISSHNATVVSQYAKVLIPILEDLSFNVARRANDTQFQRCEIILNLLLKDVNSMLERADLKCFTPRTQATLSSFFSPKETSQTKALP